MEWLYTQQEWHGLTVQQARDFRRGKVCAICGSPDQLVVDHDHATKKIRDVLCRRCNTGLGNFKEDPDLLALACEYLRSHSEMST